MQPLVLSVTSSFPSFCIIYFLSCLPPGVAAVPFLHRLLLCKINFPPPDSPAKCFISLMFCLALFFPQLLQLSPRRFPPMAGLQHPLPPTFLHVVLPSGRAPWCRPYSIYIYIYIFFLGWFFFPFMWGKIDFVDVEVSNGAVLPLSSHPGWVLHVFKRFPFQLTSVARTGRNPSMTSVACYATQKALCKQRAKYAVFQEAQSFTDNLSCKTKTTPPEASEKNYIWKWGELSFF